MKNKKVLVTGGTGAIGTVLVRKIAHDNDVTVVDNLSSSSISNLDGVDCRIIVADIRDGDKMDAVFERDYDVVVHLAAHFANQNSIDYPLSDESVNIAGTVELLQRCRKCMPRFVYASSSCLYGGGEPPFTEDRKIDDLHTPYAISKYGGELYSKFYARHYGLETVSLRFFNSFGPYDLPGAYRNVLPNFLLRAMRGQELTITGDGNETRDFNFSDNTVGAIIRAATTPYEQMPQDPVFNVGTGRETRILYLAEQIKELPNSQSEIIIKGRRKWDHTSRRAADIGKISEYLGYRPEVGFDEGLKRTVEWFVAQDWSRF